MRNDMVIGDAPRLIAAPVVGGSAIADGDRRVTWQEPDRRVTRVVGEPGLRTGPAGLAGASA